MISSVGSRVHGFECTGYLVSGVRGTWFQEYGVQGT